MNHLKSFRTLNRTHSHRKALYRNMVEALFLNERIKTTKIKAMEIRKVAEKIITRAKDKNLHNIRILSRMIKDKKILMKLFDEIGPRFKDRKGGYTRVYKLAKRKGDGADMAYLMLIEDEIERKKKKKKKIKETETKKTEIGQAKNETEVKVEESKSTVEAETKAE